MVADLPFIERIARAYQIMSEIRTTALKSWEICQFSDPPQKKGEEQTREKMIALTDHLYDIMPTLKGISKLLQHISFNMRDDYWDIVAFDLPQIETKIAELISNHKKAPQKLDFEHLLHPQIKKACLKLYQDEHYRQAVISAYDTLSDIMRERTGLTIDGADLVNQTLSPKNPKLIIQKGSDETSKNLQSGYADLLRGAYAGIRNVYVHGGNKFSVSAATAARHLIFASTLATRLLYAVSASDE